MKYRAEIDGLRALAVIPVILYHAGFKLFSGGYVGVDVFFVISGYLITTIILAELEAGTFSLIHFYERRARRILPALFVVMFVCLPFAWFWLLPDAMKQFSESLVAVSTFASNILFWRTSGYFDTATELKPLIHTWSLAVEEQYYVLFPLFLMLAWKLGKRWIVGLLAVVFVISLAGAQWLSATHPSFNFFMLPTRGWELLIGAFIAFYYSRHNIKKHHHFIEQLGSLIGLLLITYSVFAYNDQTPFPSVYALVPTLGAALIIIFATHKTIVGKLLGSKLFVALGLVSYSAYLWHQPMFAFARERSLDEPSLYLMSALAILSFGFAYLSWKYVERPFRNKHRISRNKVFAYGALCSALFIGIGLAGYLCKGFESRLSATEQALLSYVHWGDSNYVGIYRMGTCFLEPEQSYKSFSDDCLPKNINSSVLIWGDSHAASLSLGMRQVFPNVVQYTASGCPPVKDGIVTDRPFCKEINDFVFEKIRNIKPKAIYMSANWNRDPYKAMDIPVVVEKTIKEIQRISPSSQIVLIGTFPQWLPNLPTRMYKIKMELEDKVYLSTPLFSNITALDNSLNAVATKRGIEFYSVLDTSCINDSCLATTLYDGKIMPTAWDYGHLTNGGAVRLANKIKTKAN